MPGAELRSSTTALARLGRLLRAQGLGVACGLLTVLLLATGSFVMAATGDGASQGIALDDIRPFFARPAPAHAWFYLLLPTLGLYALSTLLATSHSLQQRWHSEQRGLATYGLSVLHLSFLVALGAHLVGGLWGQELGVVRLDDDWQALPGGGQARLASLDEHLLPTGGVRQIDARVELRDDDGGRSTQQVAYNAPLSQGLGSRLFLVLRHATGPGAAVVQAGAARCTLEVEAAPCRLGAWSVALRGVQELGGRGHPIARLALRGPDGGWREAWLAPGGEVALDDATRLQLVRYEVRSSLLLRGRRAPGNPVALVAAVLLGLGLLMMWRRFVPARRSSSR